jgi:hypothetical protein
MLKMGKSESILPLKLLRNRKAWVIKDLFTPEHHSMKRLPAIERYVAALPGLHWTARDMTV